MIAKTENLNVLGFDSMPSPAEIKSRVPLTQAASDTVVEGRRALMRILDREDPRLRALSEKVADTLCIVMRVYFEKPRTTTGWKGYINDPRMDDSFHIEEGMERGRRFLRDVAEVGLPAATEALDPISPQYYGDLVSWTAIGARTSESQTHREMASGLSTPVGFKNGTDGDVDAAVNAI